MATDSDEFFFHLLNSVALYRANLASLPVSNELYFVDQVMRSWPVSSAQNFQDLFIALYHQHARGKFFVEFGATDGVALSNTLMLERELGWSGILAEPARGWHAALRQNRRGVIDTRCVWKASGETIDFIEPAEGSFSTIVGFENGDNLAAERVGGNVYPVETVSLLDLLIQHKAPRTIDYLSIDTEGSELDILTAFDFDRFDVRAITVEHNHTEAREDLFNLLTGKGFVRMMPALTSQDDWYVKP